MLQTLPSELVSEIASHLTYNDICALRQAFTDLDLAVNAHVVWLSLATQYLAENPQSQFSKRRSLYSLTTNQLRRRFEKRVIANSNWPLSKNVHTSMKRPGYPPYPMMTIKIAPGGRWLFGGTQKSRVYYWDLDSKNPMPVLLEPFDGVRNIPGSPTSSITQIDFVVQRSDPLSGFVVAFVGCDLKSESDVWLYIWEVKPQKNRTLRAKHLKALPLPNEGSDSSFSFNEHIVARCMQMRIDVYWWNDCTNKRLVRCTLRRFSIMTNVYVLGNDKILVYTKHPEDSYKVRLYILEPANSPTSEYRLVVSHATKIWSLCFRCEYRKYEISRLYFDGVNYRQAIATLDGIFGLTIPASQPDKPTLEKLSDFDLYLGKYYGHLYGLGLNKGYCSTGDTFRRFGYSWGPTKEVYDHVEKYDRTFHGALGGNHLLYSFDDEIGRLVTAPLDHSPVSCLCMEPYNIIDIGTASKPCTDERSRASGMTKRS